jgi:hypothetical protein
MECFLHLLCRLPGALFNKYHKERRLSAFCTSCVHCPKRSATKAATRLCSFFGGGYVEGVSGACPLHFSGECPLASTTV